MGIINELGFGICELLLYEDSMLNMMGVDMNPGLHKQFKVERWSGSSWL